MSSHLSSHSSSTHLQEKIQANGITIAYESVGPKDGETVLLIGGTGNQLIDWPVELVEELVRRGFRVVRFDNRDAGLSTKFTEAGYPDSAAIKSALEKGLPAPIPYSLGDMAGDCAGLLKALGIRKAHLVGVSMGGAIAQLAAIDHPECTFSLTLLMTDSGNPEIPIMAKPEIFTALPPIPPEGDVAGYVEYNIISNKLLSSPGFPTEDAVIRDRVQRGVDRSYEPAGLARQQTAIFIDYYLNANHRHENLKNIKVPTIVVQGVDDPIVSIESARDITDNIAGAELILIPGLGHDLPTQLISTFADAITRAAQRSGNLNETT